MTDAGRSQERIFRRAVARVVFVLALVIPSWIMLWLTGFVPGPLEALAWLFSF